MKIQYCVLGLASIFFSAAQDIDTNLPLVDAMSDDVGSKLHQRDSYTIIGKADSQPANAQQQQQQQLTEVTDKAHLEVGVGSGGNVAVGLSGNIADGSNIISFPNLVETFTINQYPTRLVSAAHDALTKLIANPEEVTGVIGEVATVAQNALGQQVSVAGNALREIISTVGPAILSEAVKVNRHVYTEVTGLVGVNALGSQAKRIQVTPTTAVFEAKPEPTRITSPEYEA